jgi:hypothetical protein
VGTVNLRDLTRRAQLALAQRKQATGARGVKVYLVSNGRDLELPEDELPALPPSAPCVVLFEIDEKGERRRDTTGEEGLDS